MLRTIFPLIVCSLFLSQLPATVLQAALTAPRISVQEANRLLGKAVFVDIRREEAWQASDSMIKTAVRRNYKLAENWVREYPKNAVIIVYDESDDESLSAIIALELIREGYDNAYALQGGWPAWIGAGLPVEAK